MIGLPRPLIGPNAHVQVTRGLRRVSLLGNQGTVQSVVPADVDLRCRESIGDATPHGTLIYGYVIENISYSVNLFCLQTGVAKFANTLSDKLPERFFSLCEMLTRSAQNSVFSTHHAKADSVRSHVLDNATRAHTTRTSAKWGRFSELFCEVDLDGCEALRGPLAIQSVQLYVAEFLQGKTTVLRRYINAVRSYFSDIRSRPKVYQNSI